VLLIIGFVIQIRNLPVVVVVVVFNQKVQFQSLMQQELAIVRKDCPIVVMVKGLQTFLTIVMVIIIDRKVHHLLLLHHQINHLVIIMVMILEALLMVIQRLLPFHLLNLLFLIQFLNQLLIHRMREQVKHLQFHLKQEVIPILC
jgi:hypothetical protein